MAPSSKANYKSYEAQARLVRAIVAAHPEVKWNYKDISKYFGQSTPDGVQFQFRTIKKDAETLRVCEAAGGDVANCVFPAPAGSNSSFSTPVKQTATRAPRGSGAGTGSRRTTAKRPAAGKDFIKRSDSDMEEEDDDDVNSSENWSAKDVEDTPSKRIKKEQAVPRKKTNPSRHAATKANATIAAESQLQVDEDSTDEPAPLESIFGSVDAFKPEPHIDSFSPAGQDVFLPEDLSSYVDMDNFMGDGEI